MNTITKYVCGICGSESEDKALIEKCEAHHRKPMGVKGCTFSKSDLSIFVTMPGVPFCSYPNRIEIDFGEGDTAIYTSK